MGRVPARILKHTAAPPRAMQLHITAGTLNWPDKLTWLMNISAARTTVM
jgi:hypothetical protein